MFKGKIETRETSKCCYQLNFETWNSFSEQLYVDELCKFGGKSVWNSAKKEAI